MRFPSLSAATRNAATQERMFDSPRPRLMRNVGHVFIAIMFSALLLIGSHPRAASAQITCPPCYTDETPPPGHGAAPDGSGRRVMNIYIDSSWDSSPGTTNSQIWNAVQQAAANWNNATDASGNHTGYYFQLNEPGGIAQADLIITKGSLSGATSKGGGGFDPDLITLNTWMDGSNFSVYPITTASAAGTIAHEFGHDIGLGDALPSGSCAASNSIMEEAYSDGVAQVSSPSSGDVSQSNHNLNTRSSCQEPISTDQNLGQSTDDGTDPGRGGGNGGGGGGGGQPPPCTPGQPPCNNCIPPTCWGGDTWNPATCECWLPTGGTPIIIDTDGSGFHLTSASDGVLFDFSGNGNKVQIAWTQQGSTNGWLALDRNSNGAIDSAKELFGNITEQPPSSDPNGFFALAVFDKPGNGGNGDGVIDVQDAIWPQLLVWIDSNHDGISQANELHHLDDLGIKSISLKYVETRYTDQFGNQFRYRGWVTPEQQTQHVDRRIYDVILTELQSQTTGRWTLDNAIKRSAFATLQFAPRIRSGALRGSTCVSMLWHATVSGITP
jgi:hypothetical protein